MGRLVRPRGDIGCGEGLEAVAPTLSATAGLKILRFIRFIVALSFFFGLFDEFFLGFRLLVLILF